jgi:hypothetical protein
MQRFWMILVACAFFFVTLPAAAQAPTADPSKTPASKGGTAVLQCEDIPACAESVKKRTRNTSRWVACTIPPRTRIENKDGSYSAVTTPETSAIVDGKCVCPAGFTLSKAFKMVGKSEQKDGTILQSWELRGECLPGQVEPNADVIAAALNRQRDFIKTVDARSLATENTVAGIKTTLGGQTRMINYNAEEIDKLKKDVDTLKAFMDGTCQAGDLPENWKELCGRIDELERLKYSRAVFRLGAAGVYSRYPGRNYAGVALEGGYMSPRTSPTSPLRLEVGGRVGVGSAGNMDTSGNGSSAVAYNTTLYAGPVFDLDEKGQYKLHTRGMVEALWRTNAFAAMSRRYGGELAFSVCPFAEGGAQSSFCFVPSVNLTHGRSAHPLKPTEEVPQPGNRGESNVTAGGAVTSLWQF